LAPVRRVWIQERFARGSNKGGGIDMMRRLGVAVVLTGAVALVAQVQAQEGDPAAGGEPVDLVIGIAPGEPDPGIELGEDGLDAGDDATVEPGDDAGADDGTGEDYVDEDYVDEDAGEEYVDEDTGEDYADEDYVDEESGDIGDGYVNEGHTGEDYVDGEDAGEEYVDDEGAGEEYTGEEIAGDGGDGTGVEEPAGDGTVGGVIRDDQIYTVTGVPMDGLPGEIKAPSGTAGDGPQVDVIHTAVGGGGIPGAGGAESAADAPAATGTALQRAGMDDAGVDALPAGFPEPMDVMERDGSRPRN
jgi:hypothetical protein